MIINHLEERLKDLQQGGMVAKFRAFDPSSWPACNRADPVENERFRQCGVDEMREMATFYQELLRKAGIEVDEVLAEYDLCQGTSSSADEGALHECLAVRCEYRV